MTILVCATGTPVTVPVMTRSPLGPITALRLKDWAGLNEPRIGVLILPARTKEIWGSNVEEMAGFGTVAGLTTRGTLSVFLR